MLFTVILKIYLLQGKFLVWVLSYQVPTSSSFFVMQVRFSCLASMHKSSFKNQAEQFYPHTLVKCRFSLTFLSEWCDVHPELACRLFPVKHAGCFHRHPTLCSWCKSDVLALPTLNLLAHWHTSYLSLELTITENLQASLFFHFLYFFPFFPSVLR